MKEKCEVCIYEWLGISRRASMFCDGECGYTKKMEMLRNGESDDKRNSKDSAYTDI